MSAPPLGWADALALVAAVRREHARCSCRDEPPHCASCLFGQGWPCTYARLADYAKSCAVARRDALAAPQPAVDAAASGPERADSRRGAVGLGTAAPRAGDADREITEGVGLATGLGLADAHEEGPRG